MLRAQAQTEKIRKKMEDTTFTATIVQNIMQKKLDESMGKIVGMILHNETLENKITHFIEEVKVLKARLDANPA